MKTGFVLFNENLNYDNIKNTSMKTRTFRIISVSLLLILLISVVGSCSSARTFSLQDNQQTQLSVGIMTGTINYGAGFYFPSSSDILDISLLKVDGTTGIVTEVSHQRIRNIQRFPLQFTMRYDKADISESDTGRILVSLSSDGAVRANSISDVITENGEFREVTITLASNQQ